MSCKKQNKRPMIMFKAKKTLQEIYWILNHNMQPSPTLN